MLVRLSHISNLGKTLALGSILTVAAGTGVIAQQTNNNSKSEIISKEGSDALKAKTVQRSDITEENVFGKAYVLSRNPEYQENLDKRYKKIFGGNKTLSLNDILSKDKNLANSYNNLDDIALSHLHKVLSIDNDTQTLNEAEYKVLYTLTDAGVMNNYNFDWQAYSTYKYTKTADKNEFDEMAISDKGKLINDLNNKYDKKNIDDVAKLISKYYFGTTNGANIIEEYLGIYDYDGEEAIFNTRIGSNGLVCFPINEAGLSIAVDNSSGEIRIKNLKKYNEICVYDWNGDLVHKYNGNILD